MAAAFFHAYEVRAYAAVLIAIEEDKRPGRARLGLEVGVVSKGFEFGRHCLAGTRFALHSPPSVSLNIKVPLIESPLTLPV